MTTDQLCRCESCDEDWVAAHDVPFQDLVCPKCAGVPDAVTLDLWFAGESLLDYFKNMPPRNRPLCCPSDEISKKSLILRQATRQRVSYAILRF